MSGGVIAVEDTYGDGVFSQKIESCAKCGALTFVAAAWPGGGSLDTREVHRNWHATLGIGDAS